VAADNSVLQMRIKEITQSRVHYGYRRVHVLLKREGFKENHKRVYRLYRQQGLSLRHKRPMRNMAVQLSQVPKQAQRANQIWSMDLVGDNLFDGRKLHLLTVVDCYTRDGHKGGQSLKRGGDVVLVLKAVVSVRAKPVTIKSDYGSEFVGKGMDRWAFEQGIAMDLSRPRKLTANAMLESFNGKLLQECLNQH
jgi:putative transposase